jgi:cystathionine beta-lyase
MRARHILSLLRQRRRKKTEIKDELIRLALGIEDPKDIIADLKQAFNKI